MKKLVLLTFSCLLMAALSFAQTVNITFELNSATLSGNIDPSGLYVAGGSGFGSPGDNQLLDPDGDGIYTITLTKNYGFSSHYTFLNGNCPGWGCKENIGGLPCADPSNFNDRFLPFVTQDTTIKACFGTCDSDGSCTIITDTVNVTFELNTNLITVDPGGVFIAGGGNFGVPGDNQLLDPDGDGIYSITLSVPKGFFSFYTFANGPCGDFSCKEDISGLPCADPNNFNDRFLPAIYSDTTVKSCFNNCQSDGTCNPLSTFEALTDPSFFNLQPTIISNEAMVLFSDDAVNEEKQIRVMNAMGQTVLSTSVNYTSVYRLDATNLSNGIYFIAVFSKERKLTKKFMVVK